MDGPELFRRHPANPILQIEDMPLPCKAVCNPTAYQVNGETLLLLRVIDMEDHSHLLVARSADGVSDWRLDTAPLLSPDLDAASYEILGCEDGGYLRGSGDCKSIRFAASTEYIKRVNLPPW